MLFQTNPENEPNLTLLFEIRAALLEADIYACDIEATGLSLDDDSITMISFATKNKSWALRISDYPLETILKVLGPVFADEKKTVVFHNSSYDTKMLYKAGIHFFNEVHDTMIMAWLYDEDRIRYGSYGLKECVLKELNYEMTSYKDATSLFGDMDTYSADDAKQTLRLYEFYKHKLEQLGVWDWYIKVEAKVTRVIFEMELRGVALDKKVLKELKAEAYKQLEEISAQIYKLVGYEFDIGSAQQCARILFDEMKLGARSNGTNKYTYRSEKSQEWSTANEVLEAMHRDGLEIATKLLDYREVNTRLNVFITPLYERCRVSNIIHPSFLQTRTVTGRLASKDPNYQNLPRKGGIRKAFISRVGYKILRCDYSQAELRLMAHMSDDPTMINIYTTDGDIHQTTADACKVNRQAAKPINFGLVYRMSAARLQGQLAIEGIIITIEEAQQYVKRYFEKYKKVREYHNKVEKKVLERLHQNGQFGYVRTLGGRYRKLDKAYLENKETAYTAITQAINTTIQGGVGDMIKVAMVDIQEEFKRRGWLDPTKNIWDATIVGSVHDELMIECKEELVEEASKIVQEKMVGAGVKYKIKVPMKADVAVVDNLAKG